MEPRERAQRVARCAAPSGKALIDAATQRDGARELVVEETAQRRHDGRGAQQGTVGE
jgi:hypothetical protein